MGVNAIAQSPPSLRGSSGRKTIPPIPPVTVDPSSNTTAPKPQSDADKFPILLGGDAGWQFDEWRSITDSIRGGDSVAFLEATEAGAKFSGELRPEKLGAGFAGMEISVKVLPRTLKGLKGLRMKVSQSDGAEYSMSLKMQGNESGASHKFRFTPAPGDAVVEMPFADFVGTYRGRSSDKVLFEEEKVQSLTLQRASKFGEQKGPFSMIVTEIAGIPATQRELREPL
jgi:hypothetical protein